MAARRVLSTRVTKLPSVPRHALEMNGSRPLTPSRDGTSSSTWSSPSAPLRGCRPPLRRTAAATSCA
eukprot:7542372-Pyramimonas_sp.AAC.1